MADTGIFATTAEVQRKVGANASTTSNAEAYINQFMTEVESFINSTCRYNFSDNYTSLNVDVKGLLKQAASAKAAMMVIAYDGSGFPSGEEALRLNVLRDEFIQSLTLLKEQKVVDFMNAA